LADHPLKNTAEVELICQRCGYRMARTPMMNADQNRKRIRREPDTENLAIGLMYSAASIACGDAVEPTP
jgi:C4-type Zn-finger protein